MAYAKQFEKEHGTKLEAPPFLNPLMFEYDDTYVHNPDVYRKYTEKEINLIENAVGYIGDKEGDEAYDKHRLELKKELKIREEDNMFKVYWGDSFTISKWT